MPKNKYSDDGLVMSTYNPRLLTMAQVGARLGVSESTIHRRCKHGQIPVVRIGVNLFIFEDECPPSLEVLPRSPFTRPEDTEGLAP